MIIDKWLLIVDYWLIIRAFTFQCLRCTNPLAKLFNHVAAGQDMKFIVAVSDTNVVAIWRKRPLQAQRRW